jgi:hypothetical protein
MDSISPTAEVGNPSYVVPPFPRHADHPDLDDYRRVMDEWGEEFDRFFDDPTKSRWYRDTHMVAPDPAPSAEVVAEQAADQARLDRWRWYAGLAGCPDRLDPQEVRDVFAWILRGLETVRRDPLFRELLVEVLEELAPLLLDALEVLLGEFVAEVTNGD